jgi:hypothetical protein
MLLRKSRHLVVNLPPKQALPLAQSSFQHDYLINDKLWDNFICKPNEEQLRLLRFRYPPVVLYALFSHYYTAIRHVCQYLVPRKAFGIPFRT